MQERKKNHIKWKKEKSFFMYISIIFYGTYGHGQRQFMHVEKKKQKKVVRKGEMMMLNTARYFENSVIVLKYVLVLLY